jgi:phytoene dehydrogenase-like protein
MGDSVFDVVVIGAGLGGLISANYLAKSGLRVLVLEQHSLPGGCCSSFERDGFVFDSGAHSLGSCRADGEFGGIFKDLDLNAESGVVVERAVPSDVVVTRDFTLTVRGQSEEIIEEFSRCFPAERVRIKRFVNEVNACNVKAPRALMTYVQKYQGMTFREMLDAHFHDEKLKQVICVFLGNVGLPSTHVSAMRAIVMLKEFILDGGYYIVGGMHRLVERLATDFVKRGGVLKYQVKVTRILVTKKGVAGVAVTSGDQFHAKIVISNASLRQTFCSMLEPEVARTFAAVQKLQVRINGLLSSISAVVAYLGLKRKPDEPVQGRTVWYMPSYDADGVYADVFAGRPDLECRTFLAAFPARFDETLAPRGHECVNLFALAPFMNERFWKMTKEKLLDTFLDRASNLIPHLRNRVVMKEMATPITIQRYTLNDNGAMYGLASTMSQLRSNVMPQKSVIPGLYLASHWATVGTGQGGTPMAAYAGRSAARLALTYWAKSGRSQVPVA